MDFMAEMARGTGYGKELERVHFIASDVDAMHSLHCAMVK